MMKPAISASCFFLSSEPAPETVAKQALQKSLHLGTWHLLSSWRLTRAQQWKQRVCQPTLLRSPMGTIQRSSSRFNLKHSSLLQQLTTHLCYTAGKSNYSCWLGKVVWNASGSGNQAYLKYSCLFKAS